MLNYERRFYVYLHIVKTPFNINNIQYDVGDVAYVGAGQRSRVIVKDKTRSSDHLKVWDYLDKIIIHKNLTEDEKHKIEAETIEKFSSSGKLLNKRKHHNFTQEIPFVVFSHLFAINNGSPSNLSWNNGFKNNKFITTKSGNYYIVHIAGKLYLVSRILWSLYNQADCPVYKIVDHIDGNPSNNRADNLRLTTYSENVANRKITDTTGITFKVVNGIKYVVINLSRNHQTIRICLNSKKIFPNLDSEYSESLVKEIAVEMRKQMLSMLQSGTDVTSQIKQELLDSLITSKLLTLEKEI